jgi:hypothetical protein
MTLAEAILHWPRQVNARRAIGGERTDDRMSRKVLTLEYHPATPFDSVENTQEYFTILSETLLEVQREIDAQITVADAAKLSRRVEALRLVLFKLQKLEEHVKSSNRLLNDLRMLRRLLLQSKVKIEGANLK